MNSNLPSRRQLLFSFFAALFVLFGWRPLAARQCPPVAKKRRLPAQGFVQGYSVTRHANGGITITYEISGRTSVPLSFPSESHEGPETVILTLSPGSYVVTPMPESFSLTI